MWKKLNERGREARTLELLLRIGVAGCYVGHGAFGVIGKEAWLPYFAVAGIGPELARLLMPVVGTVDILVGVSVLLAPRPAALAYAGVWAIWTALLRPLAGESVFETLERAGNYGVPIAFLIFAGVHGRPTLAWLRSIDVPQWTAERRVRVMFALRAATATLLAGHGGLAFLGKPLLASHAAAVGLPEGSLALVGAFELALAGAVALRPSAGLLLGVLAWKLGTEALYPLTGAPVWEFVERAGSYVAPLALWTLTRERAGSPVRIDARGVAALVLALGVGAGVGAVPAAPASQEASLLAELRAGGYVLACRHAITDRSRGDARRVDFDDPNTQRVLNEEGRAQARRLGEVIRKQRIPIGEVLTSPYARTAESAELGFGRAQVEEALYGGGGEKRRRLQTLLGTVPERGNRVLMTHQGTLYDVLDDVERGSIREGDCVVVDPRGDGHRSVARLGPEEFEALSLETPMPMSETRRAVEAARRGGTVLVCRHAITNSFQEREPVSYADTTTQRLLDGRGERQSRRLGADLAEVGVEIGEVVASPMSRARRTAELMTGRAPSIDAIWHTNGSSYTGPARDARRRVLSTPVPRGNRLVVSHIGTMESVLEGIGGRVGEGDCVVVRPLGSDGYEVLGVVAAEAWVS